MMVHQSAQHPTQYGQLRVAVLTAGPSTGELGGAQRFYDGLLGGLLEIGCRAELISVPAGDRSFEEIESNYEKWRQLDLSAFDIVVSSKAPTYAVNHPRHVVFHNHTIRVFYDMFVTRFPNPSLEEYVQRARLFELDFQALSKVKAIFSQGHETANRLYRWLGLKSEVLPAPLGIKELKHSEIGDYFFLPGRLHPWKRVDLVIDAVRLSPLPLRLVISGTGEAESELKLRAGNDPRIDFVGRVNDEKLIELYANSLAVPFVPIREDYGYITLEAFASAKAVVTCSDSGEPTYFVRNGDTGLVCEPNPESIRQALEWLFTHRDDARQMGQRGKDLTADMSWPNVATRLVEAALAPVAQKPKTNTKVAVLDMQPIDPPVGGGRLRLLGLYHNLGEGLECQYVGTYDWPGESYRKHRLSPCLEEIDIPLSDEHHSAAQALRTQAEGKTVIDIAFGRLGHLSPAYIEAARKAIQEADVVVFSHPWVYPLVARDLSPRQVVVYDSQNVEGYLRAQLLDEQNHVEAELLRQVVIDEYELGRRAELILACSREDLQRFNRIYDFPLEKMRVVPNGVMAFSKSLLEHSDKHAARKKLRLDQGKLAVIFIGSAYGPNVAAGRFIIEHLASALSDVIFVLAGGVGTQLSSEKPNVVITGPLDEKEKHLWLCAADIAVNPMFSGSGTNIKMFDFMATHLPTVTTAIGARGIETGGQNTMVIVEPSQEAFTAAINMLRNESLRTRIGDEARLCVEEGYAWERISESTGGIFQARHCFAGQPKHFFSVVVPTYERHQQLDSLISCLQKQIERDFEVVIVDQSAARWPGAVNDYGFPCNYFHSPVKGVVRARNTGAMLAQGSVIAFTDDDCMPAEHWLINARKYFQSKNVVGVEGMVISDHLDDPDWRPVTNVGFEGIGFITANLMVRSGVFQQLGGFDLQFDKPHFREDTDLGWRMQECGRVPYANDVIVFHPAQSRAIERESASTRARFFLKDVLLYKKHPTRYHQLFFSERHFINTLGYQEHLMEGFISAGVTVPEWIISSLTKTTIGAFGINSPISGR
jgi:glycosyltransferase involved in cell wall biosynthesis/GT2 family glycosyltransferase